MHVLPEGPVLAGVDGSPAGRPAVIWAARFAAARGRPLRLLYVHPYPMMMAGHAPAVLPMPQAEWQPAVQPIVDDAVAAATEAAGPDLDVRGEISQGFAAGELIGRAAHIGTLVVGSRGLGGFTGLVLGSVGVQTSAHAPCPVVVVPPEPALPASTGPVVIGVDGSELSLAAVAFAFQEAELRDCPLVAVSAWSAPAGMDLAGAPADIEGIGADQDRALSESLAGFQTEHPDVPVHRAARLANAPQLLLEAATDAQLLVVGSRGRGGFKGLLLGSVSQTALQHAGCPVAVIKPDRPT